MMIFVTIGTQVPFDRLVKTMEEIAEKHSNISVVAQVSKTQCLIKHMRTFEFISPLEFKKLFEESNLVVSHAGMGTIISALQINKPIIVMPRLASLAEHRNGHQLATAKKMKALKYVQVAFDTEELKLKVESFINDPTWKPFLELGEHASKQLIISLSEYIAGKE